MFQFHVNQKQRNNRPTDRPTDQPTHRRFLSIHLSRFNKIVASFLCAVYFFRAKVMPFYCCCSFCKMLCASRLKRCTKMARKNVRATSYGGQWMCTNFFTFKSDSHALFLFSNSHSFRRVSLWISFPYSTHTHTERERVAKHDRHEYTLQSNCIFYSKSNGKFKYLFGVKVNIYLFFHK